MKSASEAQIKEKAQAQDEGKMATAVAQPVSALKTEEGVMDTIPRPQKRDDAASVKENGEEAYKPDLSKEVSMLSTKLINAINHQTNLDDSLQATRHELDWARQEVKRVKAEKQSLDDAVAQGVLVKKSEVDRTIAELRAQLAIEKMNRESAEKSKKATEGELENLTSSLFEEANKMVEAAKKETKAVEKRNSQLKSQLNDQEAMLKSQQEQIQDIRLTLERTETNARESGSTPGTPITGRGIDAQFDAPHSSPRKNELLEDNTKVPPDHPLHFSNLITPVLRTDVASYTDFAELLAWARRGAPHSRSASGNMASASSTNLSTTAISAAATSSPNLPGAFFGSSSANSSPNASTFTGAYAGFTPPLKESRFYKRALIEDIEPTLRLDLAPGLSFLSRRTVNSALLNGTLSIEPFTPPTKFYSPIFACSLCGEARKEERFVRRHRFRTSESEDASKYPLCEFCLGRVRAAADFVGFLRMVRDGHWRCEGPEGERGAWEEAVRLRERMFWARVGGGVIPVGAVGRPRDSGAAVEWEADAEGKRLSSAPESALESAGVERVGTLEAMERQNHSNEIEEASEDNNNVGDSSGPTSSGKSSPPPPTAEGEDFRTPEQEIRRPFPSSRDEEEEEGSGSGSEREQADAEAQLRSEASNASEVERARSDTPQPTPETVAEKLDEAPSAPPTSTTAVPVEKVEVRPESRPSTATSSTSRKDLSPGKATRPNAGMEERRPSSASSVLARVRAMEAKGK